MCTCGLLSVRKRDVVESHCYHAQPCIKFDQSKQPPNYTQLHSLKSVLATHNNARVLSWTSSRKYEWQPIVDSMFEWICAWFPKSTENTWPRQDFPWLQWVMHHHFNSDYLFCRKSTEVSVAKKARTLAITASMSSESFKKRLKRWWTNMRQQVVGLSNRQFKAQTHNEHMLA